ncbi:hypothetical protein [Embleya sp. NPDC005971]|uniref:hypothetical protein n=1 Tax=Embleya sp. NPDC005971 TaxID=3156724 RepID=UPI0033C0B796
MTFRFTRSSVRPGRNDESAGVDGEDGTPDRALASVAPTEVAPARPSIHASGGSVAAGNNVKTVVTGNHNVMHVYSPVLVAMAALGAMGLVGVVVFMAVRENDTGSGNRTQGAGPVASGPEKPRPATIPPSNGGPGMQPSTTSPPSASVADTPPLTASVDYAPDPNKCHGWLFPGKSPRDIPVPPGEPTAEWAHGLGGIDRDTTPIVVTVEGKHDYNVTLRAMRVVERQESKLAPGTNVTLRLGCGSGLPIGPRMVIDLAAENPRVEQEDGGEFSYKVAGNDTQRFGIDAQSPVKEWRTCDCVITWKLALDWTYQGKQGTLIIDDQGAPFRTGSNNSTEYPTLTKSGAIWE